MDMSLLERVNPIYNTAKMTLCGLAQAGDRDADIILKKLGLTPEKSQDSTMDPLFAIQSQANAVVESNTHARHLYERLGFTQLGTIPGGFRMKDGHYENICPYYHEL